MRPISLSISGLHSFRQKQTIDFSQLYDTGVFGIFGPTGSGKSTILDAITLALYGRVERSDKNRVGIINQQEDKIHVKFIFELSSSKASQRYIVERMYNRTDGNRIRSSIARFIKVEGETEVVVADKETDVNHQVEELLGLKNDDFTRAVVLPQGKFAEFLTLKASARREMLERLFNLEQYGNKLREKVNNQRKELEASRDQLIAQQEVLSHATKESLKQLEKELQEVTEAKNSLEKQRETFLAEYKVIEKRWETQQELMVVREQLEELNKREEEIATLTVKKEQAEKAAIVQPTVKQYRGLKDQLAKLSQKITELTAAKEKLQLEVKIKQQAYEEAKKVEEEQTPTLTNRKYELQQALEIENDIKTINDGLQELEQSKTKLKPEQEALEKEIGALEEKLAEESRLIKEMNNEIDQLTITTEERKQLDKALTIRQEQLQLEKDITANKKELSELEKKLVELEKKSQEYQVKHLQEAEKLAELDKEFNHLQENQPMTEDAWHQKEKSLYETELILTKLKEIEAEKAAQIKEREQVNEGLHALQESLNKKEKELERLQSSLEEKKAALKQLEELKQANLANSLAKQLKDGKPCLVCGSTHHPDPNLAEVNHEVEADIEALHKEITKSEESLTNTRIEYKGLENNIKLQTEQLEKLEIQIVNKDKELQEKKSALPSHFLELAIEEIAAALSKESSNHQQLKKELQGWKEKREKLTEEKHLQKDIVDKLDQEQKLVGNQVELNHENKTKHTQAIEKLTVEKENVEQKWTALEVEWDFDTVLKHKEQIEANDIAREKLQKQLKEKQTSQENAIEQQKQITTKQAEIKKELDDTEAAIKAEKRALTEAQEKVERITNKEPTKELLEKVEKELAELKEKLIQSEKAYKEKSDSLSEVDRDLGAKQAVSQELITQFNDTKEQLDNLLQAHHFVTMEQVEEGHLPKEEVEGITKTIKEFTDKKYILSEKEKQYTETLNGEELTKEAWDEKQQLKLTLEEEFEQAKNKAAELTFTYNQRQKDYNSWKELEKERKEVQDSLDIASELSDVLKGNAFVDFIAQEYLRNVTIIASEKLKQLTRNRYSIEVDVNGEFTLVDELNGNLARPVQSLSGGETFLTSLALALALSSQIQLKGGKTLEFFFLDEGFGSLDTELLDTVMMTLEKLHAGHMTIGVISHVPELQSRINRKVVVTPPDAKGDGSKVSYA